MCWVAHCKMPVCYLCNIEISNEDSEQLTCSDHAEVRYFCSQLHMSYHRPGGCDSGPCLPWSISSSDQYGRYLVASRDIMPGDMVLSETSVCWGPNHELDIVVCVECLTDISEDGQDTWCQMCGAPLCSGHADTHPTQILECNTLTTSGGRKIFHLSSSGCT